MSIKRNVPGVMDFLFDKLEEIDARDDLEFEKKVKLFDQMLKNVWQAGKAQMEFKRLMLRAPDIAQNEKIVLDLGTTKQIEAPTN